MIIQRASDRPGIVALRLGEAENGAQAMGKAPRRQPKLILSDWNMPEMSGIDFLVQVRAAQNDVPSDLSLRKHPVESRTSP